MSVSYGGDTITFADSSTISSGWTGFKNRIINGGMVIDQRNNGASTTGSNTLVFSSDRWASFEDSDGVLTLQRSSQAPTGFANSIVATTTTEDSSLASNQRAVIVHRIEGYNIADLKWGTAQAQTVTLSFWVRCSLTGTFGGTLTNTSRAYPFTYTISNADTWEYKTITIPGDTSGTWDSTNGFGVQITYSLGAGTTFCGTVNTWQNGDLNSVTGTVSVIGTLNATWYLTGVQFERGSTASSFEYRPYGTELALCQRYYQTWHSGWYGVIAGTGYGASSTVNYFVPMRASPTVTKGTFTGGSARWPTANWSATHSSADGFTSTCVSTSSGGNDQWTCIGNSSSEL